MIATYQRDKTYGGKNVPHAVRGRQELERLHQYLTESGDGCLYDHWRDLECLQH